MIVRLYNRTISDVVKIYFSGDYQMILVLSDNKHIVIYKGELETIEE